jgi:hypothetical protein
MANVGAPVVCVDVWSDNAENRGIYNDASALLDLKSFL